MTQVLSDEADLFSLESFNALFDAAWRRPIPLPRWQTIHRTLDQSEPDAPVRVRQVGCLPVHEDLAYEAERWDGLG